MHNTIIVLKKPRHFGGLEVRLFRGKVRRSALDPDVFEHSYILLDNSPILYICEMESAITEKERVGPGIIRDDDKIARMRSQWLKYKRGKRSLTESSFVEPENKYKYEE